MTLTLIQTAVLEEIEKRELTIVIVDFILSQLFEFTDNKFNRIKRGSVHTRIADTMSIALSNSLCHTIRDRIEYHGGVGRTISGAQYYVNMKEKRPGM